MSKLIFFIYNKIILCLNIYNVSKKLYILFEQSIFHI